MTRLTRVTLAGALVASAGLVSTAQSSTPRQYATDWVAAWEGHAQGLADRGCRILYVQPHPMMALYEIGHECPIPVGAGTVYPYVPDGATPAIGLPTVGYDEGVNCPGNRPHPSMRCRADGGWR